MKNTNFNTEEHGTPTPRFPPRFGQYFTHAHNYINPEVAAAVSSLLGLISMARLKARRLLSMVATARMMRLYACVRYWPYRGVRKFASVLKLILYKR